MPCCCPGCCCNFCTYNPPPPATLIVTFSTVCAALNGLSFPLSLFVNCGGGTPLLEWKGSAPAVLRPATGPAFNCPNGYTNLDIDLRCNPGPACTWEATFNFPAVIGHPGGCMEHYTGTEISVQCTPFKITIALKGPPNACCCTDETGTVTIVPAP